MVLLVTMAAACAGASNRRTPPTDPASMPAGGAGAGANERGAPASPEEVPRGSPDAALLTRPLEAYLGRSIWLAAPGRQPEQWLLREIGRDSFTVERTRTYRVLPLRRIAEITWTDLTGIDPTPRIVLSPE